MTEEEKELYCPNCWRTLPPDVTSCPFCGTVPEIEPFIRPKLLTMAGLMATTAACISIIAGFMSIIAAFMSSLRGEVQLVPYGPPFSDHFDLGLLLLFTALGLLNFSGFALGTIAGTYSWRKRSVNATVIGLVLLLFIGLLNLIILDVSHGFGLFWALAFGIPITVLSLLSLIFVVAKQQEFKTT